MKVSFPVILSSQMALEKRLDTVANNVANAQTVGFRAEGTRFEAVFSRVTGEQVVYSSVGKTQLSRQSGPMVKTGNMLDVAVQGEAWLALQSPKGTIYTRDGRMSILPTGELQSINGYSVLDVGGAPILLNAGDGPPTISRDGMITQAGKQVGAIGLFEIPVGANLTRVANSGVTSDRPAVAVIEFSANGIAQGFVEQSNVNPMMELSRLIEISRTFESMNSMVEQLERTTIDTIKTLGPGS